MEYLVPLMDAKQGTALRYAFNACAFALLGNRARADGVDLAQLSLKEHTLALAQTHKELGHPATASADSTLAAVLLLSLYEVSSPQILREIEPSSANLECPLPILEHNSYQGKQDVGMAFAYRRRGSNRTDTRPR
jgi:hypothetical protein